MKYRILHNTPLEFFNTSADLVGSITANGTNLKISSVSGVIELGNTATDIQVGTIGTAVNWSFMGGGTIGAAGGGTISLGQSGDTVNMNVAGVTYQYPATFLRFNQVTGVNNKIDISTSVPGSVILTLPNRPVVGQLSLTDNIASTSNITGTLQVAGGAGIGGDLYAGNIFTGPAQYVNFGGSTGTRIFRDGGLNGMSLQTASTSRLFISDSGPITVTGNTAANSNTTGALIVTGGVGVTGNLYAGNVVSLGGITVEGSLDAGSGDYAGWRANGTNIILKGNDVGRSGIFFQSEKNGTAINHPTDFGYIQFHPMGIDGSTGESNKMVIGVANDADDFLVLQSPYKNGVKISFKDATSGTGGTEYTVWHAGNHGIGSGLDADLLDGQSNTFYQNANNINAGTLAAARLASSGVTAGTYASASIIPVITVDAAGRVTAVTNTSVAIASGAVSGLAASATTDTTVANNISSGILPVARLGGSYTGITGVGTLTAGSIPTSLITGLATSATTDTTNASNISSGTLAAARLATSGVTAGVYGSASIHPVITVDAAGRVTAVTNTSVAIAAAAVSGLAASATTDTTNATNISSGTLATARLSGSYTGITGVGTLAAGSIPTSLITGLATSATTDTTNASNINAGTLAVARLPTTSIANTGTFTSSTITVDAYGRVTAASNGASGGAGGAGVSGVKLYYYGSF